MSKPRLTAIERRDDGNYDLVFRAKDVESRICANGEIWDQHTKGERRSFVASHRRKAGHWIECRLRGDPLFDNPAAYGISTVKR